MAVYTHLTNAELTMLVEQRYGLGALVAAHGIAQGVSNSNYLLETEEYGQKKRYILTLYEKRINTEELPYFIGLMKHLADKGITCPKPIADRNGDVINEVGGKLSAIVSFLEGESVTQTNLTQMASAGVALVSLHQAGADYPMKRPNALSLEGWQQLYEATHRQLNAITPGLQEQVSAELKYLYTHWPKTGLPQGVIHADLFPDNVFFKGDLVSGVIDFYFACNDFFAYDIAITINAWCFDKEGNFDAKKAEALLAAYEYHRPITAPERAALPTLLRGAAMRFLMTRCYDWINRDPSALVIPHDPMHYVRILKFHQSGGWQLKAAA